MRNWGTVIFFCMLSFCLMVGFLATHRMDLYNRAMDNSYFYTYLTGGGVALVASMIMNWLFRNFKGEG